ncbi:MAG: YvcK family protein [Myxococcales bacterium]|nr:YvcK family protein [Myxococcales bacterium]
MHIVTIGGGHGQAAMLRALAWLGGQVSAIVSIADDGGCSGLLRERWDMPPPGDLRRCLTTLAQDRFLAARFEERFEEGDEDVLRSAGNLVLFEAYVELGSLGAAVSWAAELLRCTGKVLPVAEEPGRLAVYDRQRGVVEGETTIERQAARPVVVGVHGPEHASEAAKQAVREADLILIGPGSFITSTLAALMTGDLAAEVAEASGRRVFVRNLVPEPGQMAEAGDEDYLRLLHDHLLIASGHDAVAVDVLADGERHEQQVIGDHRLYLSPLTAGEGRHEPKRVAEALAEHFGAPLRPLPSVLPPDPDAVEVFDAYLARARERVRLGRPRG